MPTISLCSAPSQSWDADVEAHILGDAAIVTGRITATYSDGHANSWRWIHVCLRRDGRWQIQSTTQFD
ncbi:MAG: DUF4440 domain-containing protein [Pyrinomonadaceae bacterium]